jgi:Tfp pilus assembly protein PilN
MRAVNLIPSDQRRGAGGLAGRSGGVVYVLTGGLAVLVALGVVYALAINSVAARKTELASLTRQVAVVSAEGSALQQYVQVALLSAEKAHEVTALAQQRFNWPGAMQQLALALPADVTFTSFNATAAGGSAASAATASSAAPAAAGGGSSFSLTGCASTQGEISTVLTNLFKVPGVSDVRLLTAVETVPPSKKKLSRQAALAQAGTCPLVTFTMGLTYSASYTVPDTKPPKGPSGHVQTVSTSSGQRPTTMAANHRSAGAGK